MSENIAPNAELDLDQWLATGERNTHNVNLYARMDLIAEVEALEAQKQPVEQVAEGDEALGGTNNPNAELEAQIDDLWNRIDQSKRVFRVTALTKQETDAIREKVLDECSDKIDKAAAMGRTEAKKTCKRMEISVPADINAYLRIGVKEFTDKVINHETTLRMIAEATKMQVGEGWKQLTLDQTRTLYEKLGESQIGLLADAAYKANNETPEVTVPKS
ncbi:hypothetical protein [Glutamicibacter sp. M10]|uniref:hypothetical protein n=1 Tax=Glutamicibacter sp. M10 TaxID=3023076 RepID=UPI0021C5FC72|nr:hypothetical protein [Glutamicibacter sp. M10]UXN31013.1 hypothetical protein N6V40_11330 [Glutamicibacter sp. M10]